MLVLFVSLRMCFELLVGFWFVDLVTAIVIWFLWFSLMLFCLVVWLRISWLVYEWLLVVLDGGFLVIWFPLV